MQSFAKRNSIFSILTMVFLVSASTGPWGQAASRNQGQGQRFVPYYGAEFYQHLGAGEKDRELKQELFRILASGHIPQKGGMDVITNGCTQQTSGCYAHHALGYELARRMLLGRLHLQGQQPAFWIHDVYCEHDYTSGDFRRGDGPGPMKIPDDKVLNTEHTWPQSRFNPRFSRDLQKSDLHHLFPSDSQMNSIRGNFKFAEVDEPEGGLPCHQSKFGLVHGRGGDYFEPPASHKGNVARALFYFSIRYGLAIDADEEAFLRKWNGEDPPDEAEVARHEAIFAAQGNRNPFIDHPELVNRINDF